VPDIIDDEPPTLPIGEQVYCPELRALVDRRDHEENCVECFEGYNEELAAEFATIRSEP
jgi:purine nucleoside phosphorylase